MCPTQRGQNRRDFVRDAVRFFYAVSAAVLAFPILSYLGAARRNLTVRDVVLDPLGKELKASELVNGGVRMAQLNDEPVLVFSGEAAPRILSAVCTHLGCTVKWSPDSAKIMCPCHGGVYDASGKPVSGPVPSALKEIPVAIRNDRMIVRRS